MTNQHLWNPWVYVTDMYGLEYITFYIEKHIAPLEALFWIPAGSWRDARGGRICVIPLF